jgi:hypothetical protein
MIDEAEAIEAARHYVKAEHYHELSGWWLYHAMAAGIVSVFVAIATDFSSIAATLMMVSGLCAMRSSTHSRRTEKELAEAKALHAKAIEP